MNYEQMSVDNIDRFIEANTGIRSYFRGRLGLQRLIFRRIETIASYQGKKEKLDVMMLSLYSPVMLMLAFYLYMAANLVIERQKTEISVLRSRGASRLQIMTAYALESCCSDCSALAAGPFHRRFLYESTRSIQRFPGIRTALGA